jgi:hypothetical protein
MSGTSTIILVSVGELLGELDVDELLLEIDGVPDGASEGEQHWVHHYKH